MALEAHIEALVNELELEPRLVRTIIIDPRSIKVETFATNDEGNKFVRSDGNVATHTLTFQHRAFFKQSERR